MNNTYDAIIIGAGHNGLTNAAYLAKAGLNDPGNARRMALLQLILCLQFATPGAAPRS